MSFCTETFTAIWKVTDRATPSSTPFSSTHHDVLVFKILTLDNCIFTVSKFEIHCLKVHILSEVNIRNGLFWANEEYGQLRIALDFGLHWAILFLVKWNFFLFCDIFFRGYNVLWNTCNTKIATNLHLRPM